MTLIINTVDFSDYIQQKVGIVETPRRVEGRGGGVSIDFEEIYDEGVTKYDFTCALMPMPADKVAQLLNACASVPCDVTYTSIFGERTITARVSIGSIKYLTLANGSRIYGESTLTVTER